MNKKAAIGLSINILVVIIISLVILGGSIALLFKFVGEAENVQKDLDSRTAQELERLLVDQGKQVALPLRTANIKRGDSHIFGLGILNTDEDTYGTQFKVIVELSDVYDEDEKDLDVNNGEINNLWPLYKNEIMIIEENQYEKTSILIKVPKTALKGTYIFNVKVLFNDGQQYGNTQKIHVNAK